METAQKNWYVDIDGIVYEATTETIDQWIWDGTMLAKHRVSREGARWLEAGKAPQFAKHFVSAQEMNDLLGSEGIGLRTAPPPRRDSAGGQTLPPSLQNRPNMFGARLIAGSAFSLVIALVAGYLWAFHISAQKDLAVINNLPEMQTLQSKYDAEKARLEGIKAAARPAAAPGSQRLGPSTSKNLSKSNCIPNEFDPSKAPICMDQLRGSMPDPGETYKKMQESIRASAPQFNPNVAAITDLSLTDLNTKFEADKNKIVTDARAADSKSRFYQVFVLLFLGLAGLNIVRLSLFSSKK